MPPQQPPHTDLPDALKPQLHDLFISKTSPLRLALARFSDALGFPFNITTSWPTIYTTFLPNFRTTPHLIIPTITTFIINHLDALVVYLDEHDDEGGFQERFVAKCEEWEGIYRQGIWVRCCKGTRPRSWFSEERGNGGWRWCLDLPCEWDEAEFRRWGGRHFMSIDEDGEGAGGWEDHGGSTKGRVDVDPAIFSASSTSSPSSSSLPSSRKRVPGEDEGWSSAGYKLRKTETDEWSVIDGHGHGGSGGGNGLAVAAATTALRGGSRGSTDYPDDHEMNLGIDVAPTPAPPPPPASTTPALKPLPKLTSIPPPHALFTKTVNGINILPPDYNHLLLITHTSGAIELQATHQPTLRLIRDYFSAHVRVNTNRTNLPPFVHVSLLESMWNKEEGEFAEVLRFTKDDGSWGARLDVAFLIAFVEGVCGYVLAEGCVGGVGGWVYRRRFPAEEEEEVVVGEKGGEKVVEEGVKEEEAVEQAGGIDQDTIVKEENH
ncbi:hypothetical protein DFH27DRAFT_626711 [Peziza echinospora]|nr:hypothetical protein DFH27DRAFT_626711 [Peziza echinospora]